MFSQNLRYKVIHLLDTLSSFLSHNLHHPKLSSILMTQLVPVPYKKHYKAEHCFDVKEYDYTMGNRIK